VFITVVDVKNLIIKYKYEVSTVNHYIYIYIEIITLNLTCIGNVNIYIYIYTTYITLHNKSVVQKFSFLISRHLFILFTYEYRKNLIIVH